MLHTLMIIQNLALNLGEGFIRSVKSPAYFEANQNSDCSKPDEFIDNQ